MLFIVILLFTYVTDSIGNHATVCPLIYTGREELATGIGSLKIETLCLCHYASNQCLQAC